MPENANEPGIELSKVRIALGTEIGGKKIYRMQVPSVGSVLSLGSDFEIGGRNYQVVSITGYGRKDEYDISSVEIVFETAGGARERMYAVKGQTFFAPDNLTPGLQAKYQRIKIHGIPVLDIIFVKYEEERGWAPDKLLDVRTRTKESIDLLFVYAQIS